MAAPLQRSSARSGLRWLAGQGVWRPATVEKRPETGTVPA